MKQIAVLGLQWRYFGGNQSQNSDGQAWDASLCASCTGLYVGPKSQKTCGARKQTEHYHDDPHHCHVRIPCWLHTTGNKRDWAPYPTPLTVGGATDRGGSGQKDKCALVSAANHLCLGDCRKPEKVIKGIYITFCTPPRVHTEMFNFILSHYGQRLHNMNNIISQIIWFDSNEDVPHQDGFM